jgi:hypothetical protein
MVRFSPDNRRFLTLTASLTSLAALAWAFWAGGLANIASKNYLPHGFCYLWNPRLLALHVISDSVIFLSYLAISLSLGWLVYRHRKLIPFAWIFIAFGIFIVACGFTHAMEIVVLWMPFYWLGGDIKLVTAVASRCRFTFRASEGCSKRRTPHAGTNAASSLPPTAVVTPFSSSRAFATKAAPSSISASPT